MSSLFTNEGTAQLRQRIDTLTPDSQRKWGTMNVSQMLAHCQAPLNVGIGTHPLGKYNFFIKMIGKMVKKSLMKDDKPFKQNQPTDKSFVVADVRGFEEEKQKLVSSIDTFASMGRNNQLQENHPFFGPLTPAEWDKLQWKHLDHHLRQFGA